MPVQKHERPEITLKQNQDGSLLAAWGPEAGPWGIFKKAAAPQKVQIKEWWLFVGTLSNHGQPDADEGSQWEIVSRSVGTNDSMVIPRHLLPTNHQVLAQVIGYFDSKNENEEPIVEGIYSNVARQVIH